MTSELPDEQGWYWCNLLATGEWCMAFVDTGREMVFLLGGDSADGFTGPSRHAWDDNSIAGDLGAIHWYGPITCPGGDFGGTTVLIDEERHLQAQREKKAIVLTYVDFRHCREDGKLGSNMTISGAVPYDEAAEYLRREVAK